MYMVDSIQYMVYKANKLPNQDLRSMQNDSLLAAFDGFGAFYILLGSKKRENSITINCRILMSM